MEGVQICTVYVQAIFAVYMRSASMQDIHASDTTHLEAFYSSVRSTAIDSQAYKFGVPETKPLTTLVIN